MLFTIPPLNWTNWTHITLFTQTDRIPSIFYLFHCGRTYMLQQCHIRDRSKCCVGKRHPKHTHTRPHTQETQRRRKWKHGNGGGVSMKLYENFGSKFRIFGLSNLENLLVVLLFCLPCRVSFCTFIRFSRSLHKHIYFSVFFFFCFILIVSFRFVSFYSHSLVLSLDSNIIEKMVVFTFISFADSVI